ncbi:MAG: thiol reductant exporter subunit CydC [Actinomycetota bacterium]
MSRLRFIGGWTLSALQAFSSIALLGTSAWLLSRAAQHPSVMYLSIAVVGVRAFALGKAFFRYTERLVLHDATFRKSAKLRITIFESLVNRAPIGLAGTRVGKIITNLVDDVDEAQNLELRFKPAVIQLLISVLFGVALFVWLTPDYWIYFVSLLILLSIFFYWLSKVAANSQVTKLAELRSELASEVQQLVQRNRVLQAYGWQKSTTDQIEVLSTKLGFAELKAARQTGLLLAGLHFALYAMTIVSMVITLLSAGLLPSEQVAVLVLLPLAIFEYLFALPQAAQSRARATAAISRISELSAIEESAQPVSSGDRELDKFNELQLLGVEVNYPGGRSVALPDFEIRTQQVVALVGPSGSGKTSVANLLAGFVRATAGVALLNGRDIGDYRSDSLNREIGILEQNPTIFEGTVRDNLKLAAPTATDAELIEALVRVQLWPSLSERQGLDTRVGSGGVFLSGGEKSRLALARNLLAKRGLIVLDEPGASIQKTLAKQLVRDLIEIAKNNHMAVILITHDRELAELADEFVYVTAQ